MKIDEKTLRIVLKSSEEARERFFVNITTIVVIVI